MARLGHFSRDLLVGRIRTDLDLFRPSDLAILADVNGAKERLVSQWRKHSSSDIIGQIDHTLHTISIFDTDAKIGQRLNLYRPVHARTPCATSLRTASAG